MEDMSGNEDLFDTILLADERFLGVDCMRVIYR